MASPAGVLPSGPRANGTAVLPDGRVVTPVGRTLTVDLLPLNTVLSHDGQRLFVSSEGGDDSPSTKENVYNRFLTVIDTNTFATTRVPDDALQYGVAEAPDGHELYLSEGESGSVGVFARQGSTYARAAKVGLDAKDFPMGSALSPDGRYLYVVGFQGNSLSVIDTQTRQRVARVGTGEFPYTVALSQDGRRAFVTNWGLFNPVADKVASNAPVDVPPLTIGGYNTDRSSSVWVYDLTVPTAPKATNKIRIGPNIDGFGVVGGSLPSSLAVSPDGRSVAVTSSNTDSVVILDATTGAVVRTFDLKAFGAGGPTGSQPNALTWAPDGKVLYVAEGGRNDIAVIDAATGTVLGRLPTGWYPSAVSVTSDGARLWVASAKGRGAGPNGVEVEAPTGNQGGNNPSYIGNLLKGAVQAVDLRSACTDLTHLSQVVDANNGMKAAAAPGGSVVPATFGTPSSKVKHVVFILKENRTYDQVFGDAAGSERDNRLALYANPVTPNHHSIARQYAMGDNYYDIGQDSFDGHFLIDSGHENEFDQKIHPTVWNANKLSPEGVYVSAPENLPAGGYMWNGLFRRNISFRIYGEATFLLGLGPTALVPPNAFGQSPPEVLPASYALQNHYSLTYPSQITPSRPAFGDGNTDEDRADDFLRELPLLDAGGQVPQFMFLWLTDDHTQGASPGAPTPEYLVARNDHALGRIVEGLTHTKAWNDMAVFVTEDDPQDGQDHVDAHRTLQLVMSPFVKHGYVSHIHHSNMSTLKTVDLLLGAPPNSLQEATATSLADYFQETADPTPFAAAPQQVPLATNPSAKAASTPGLRAAAERQKDVPPGLDRGGQALQDALRLRHEGAAQAGEPGIPVLSDTVQHTLTDGDPQPVTVGGSEPAQCGPGVRGARSVAAPAKLAATGGRATVPAGTALLAAFLLLGWCRRQRTSP
jgi:YVTN family beta-propeller protein